MTMGTPMELRVMSFNLRYDNAGDGANACRAASIKSSIRSVGTTRR